MQREENTQRSTTKEAVHRIAKKKGQSKKRVPCIELQPIELLFPLPRGHLALFYLFP